LGACPGVHQTILGESMFSSAHTSNGRAQGGTHFCLLWQHTFQGYQTGNRTLFSRLKNKRHVDKKCLCVCPRDRLLNLGLNPASIQPQLSAIPLSLTPSFLQPPSHSPHSSPRPASCNHRSLLSPYHPSHTQFSTSN
jgi:hypothetical protein